MSPLFLLRVTLTTVVMFEFESQSKLGDGPNMADKSDEYPCSQGDEGILRRAQV